MEKVLQGAKDNRSGASIAGSENPGRVIAAVLQPVRNPKLPDSKSFHVPPVSFRPTASLQIQASAGENQGSRKLRAVHLRFRRVNQAETWQVKEMELQGSTFRASIPGTYTDSPFPLQYYFECHEASGAAWLFPGLGRGCNRQPYFVVRQAER
jgi:hypothetical protein